MTNKEILEAVNYLKILEPTKNVIIYFMELARTDERNKVIDEIVELIQEKLKQLKEQK